MTGNLIALRRFANAKGKCLRPHAKTHKSSDIAKLQLQNGAIGVCAAKLSEAEALIRAGVREVLITGPIVTGDGLERLVELVSLAPGLLITIDNLEVAARLNEILGSRKKRLRCLLDIDPGFNRAGVQLEEALPFAFQLSKLSHLELCGIQCYAGHIQHVVGWRDRRVQATATMGAAAKVFMEMRKAGLNATIFSAGGTGTLEFDMEIPEITEVQAGSYLFMDTDYSRLEWGEFFDSPDTFPASVFLESTVVSANHEGFVTIDAGLKALYQDGAYPQVIEPASQGLTYEWFGDEYGKIVSRNGLCLLTVGDRVKLSLSHVDPTFNLFDFFYLVEDGVVQNIHPIDLRGCSQ